jgi:uncharacterized protein (TIGR00369 family)
LTSEVRAATGIRPERQAATPAPTSTITYRGRRIAVTPHNCFACGTLNRDGLHLVLHTDGERCWTDVTLGSQFEGWEGMAHGGIVCTILDEVMAWALIDHDAWGVTARMNVAFRRPVPIGEPVRGEGRLVAAQRRLLRTDGRIVDADGETLATAEATYVAAPEDRKRALKERYGYGLIDEADADLPESVDRTRSRE